jgi:ArsR family transcriptional regulator, arsenate/arsenite/antimonite-responsive transcriptional repressor
VSAELEQNAVCLRRPLDRSHIDVYAYVDVTSSKAGPLDDTHAVRVLKALADPKRFRMVQEIAAAGELSCGQLAEHCPVSQPTISHHLKLLVDAGVVVVRNEGKHHFVSLNQALLQDLTGSLAARLLRSPAVSKRREASKKKKGHAP